MNFCGCVGAWVRGCGCGWAGTEDAWVCRCRRTGTVGAWVRGCVGVWVRGCGRAENIPDAQTQVPLLLFPLYSTISLLGNTLSSLLLEIIIKSKQLTCFQQGR